MHKASEAIIGYYGVPWTSIIRTGLRHKGPDATHRFNSNEILVHVPYLAFKDNIFYFIYYHLLPLYYHHVLLTSLPSVFFESDNSFIHCELLNAIISEVRTNKEARKRAASPCAFVMI